MQKLRWLGLEDTRIRLVPNGEKVDLKSGEAIEISDDQAKFYTKLDRDFVIAGSPEEKEAEARLEKKEQEKKERTKAEKESKKEQEKAEKEVSKEKKEHAEPKAE